MVLRFLIARDLSTTGALSSSVSRAPHRGDRKRTTGFVQLLGDGNAGVNVTFVTNREAVTRQTVS